MSGEVDDLDRVLAVVWMSETKGDFMRARQVVLDVLAARVASAAAENAALRARLDERREKGCE